jgi:hypothetical protein
VAVSLKPRAEKFFTESMKVLPDVESLYSKADVLNNLGAIVSAHVPF